MGKPYKNTFGLAISNSVLTAVELDYGKAGLRILNYSKVELEPGIVEENCIIINPQIFKDSLLKLLLEAKNGPITSRNVIIPICEEKTFSHYLNIPREYAGNEEYIEIAAKDFIPIALDEAIIDYKQVKNKPDEKNATLHFVAVQKTIINPLIKILEEAGLNVMAVDTIKNSAIRSYENRFHKNEGDFMIVNISMEKSILNICASTGFRYDIDVNVGGRHFDEKLKEILQIPTIKDIHSLLMQFHADKNSLKPEQYESIQKGLKKCFEPFIKKSIELVKAVENQQEFKLKTIYLMGCHSCIPGLKEIFIKTFPKVGIKDKLEYIELDETTELFYINAIGSALRAILPEADENDVNLLPAKKKYELYIAKTAPAIRRYLFGFTVLFGVFLIFSGVLTTKAFTAYRVSSQQAKLLEEKTLNPYLTETAKAKQHKTQLESQMITILKDSVPGSQIMKKIDSYNLDGKNMINAAFTIVNNKEIDMRLRAKTVSREETEKFIVELETDPYYLEVISPLSNLVGQGERFVNMDLKLNAVSVIDDFLGTAKEKIEEAIQEPEVKPAEPDLNASQDKKAGETETKPESKKPAIQTHEETPPPEE
jgi:type IV pilus assembly protein PilM